MTTILMDAFWRVKTLLDSLNVFKEPHYRVFSQNRFRSRLKTNQFFSKWKNVTRLG